ncbi:uncharacterized protein LOC102806442, partial [Saccoglossus kowalevskii]|uniref:Uncharacterized protein LOC102806442 n=1 Tax=Saccoglossus kowalevskii TaxID=10224 RepID=A0ABM0MB55_SACKO
MIMSTDDVDDCQQISIEIRRCKQQTDAVSRVTAKFTRLQVITCVISEISSETCTEKLESTLEGFCSILATSQQCWLQCTEESDRLLEAYNDLVITLINYANLPTEKTNEDEVDTEDLIKYIPNKASFVFKTFTVVLNHLCALSDDDEQLHFNKSFIRTNAADFMILSARHAEIHHWSNEITRQQSL